ncbi:MAG: hypothetical protein KF847_12380 [Pirellulales bacterium]|nr:hypothetical protein [Pirellulales bacterium]
MKIACHRRRPVVRHGLTLLETIAAAAIITATLVPTMVALRNGMTQSREATQREMLANYAVRLLEEHAALTMQNWTSGTATGTFAAEGRATLKYSVVKSDQPASGGIVNRLMHIQATVYEDANGNSAWNSGELRVTVRTKVSKLASYVSAPNS